MTVTETAPEIETAEEVEPADPEPTGGLIGALGSGEHKVIGRLWIGTALLFAVFTLVIGVLIAFEQTDTSGIEILGAREVYLTLLGLFRTSLVLLVVMPLFVGLATFIVPLQIGAPSVAFPRAASAGYWTWLFSSGIYIGATLADGGLNAGGDPDATELTHMALGGVILGVLIATLSIVTTIVAERTEGMTLLRVPLFTWTMLVTGSLWLFTLPVLLANLALMWVDLRAPSLLFFDSSAATGSLPYVGWALDTPQVYVYALPLIGILAELVPVSARVRQPGNGPMMFAIGAIGLLGFGAYAQPVFNPGTTTSTVFVLQSLLLIVPLLGLAVGWIMTLRAGRPRGSVALGIAVGGFLMLLAGAGVGALRVFGAAAGGLREIDDWSWIDDVSNPFDDLAGTAAVESLFHYVLLAGLIGAVAGLYYWAPKLFGRMLTPALGTLAGLALVGGTVLAGLPQLVSGFLEEPDVYTSADVRDGVEAMNVITAVGLIVVLGGVLLVMLDLFVSVVTRSGAEAADDPWGGGQTLEWATTSPPPAGNFPAPVAVTSERPLLDEAVDETDEGGSDGDA